ncbi:MAG: response regulator transcription factor [Acholeplasma sp.]|nr:response regulator transcription factor [Acholeplasma sp.]
MLLYYVEDDASIAYVIDKTLEKMGLDKNGFQEGKSFLNAYQNNKPDLVLLDIMLPDISGIELIKEIRKVNKEIPIIVISALYSEMDKVIALDAGADDYLTKPFGILELTSRIQAKLRKLPKTKEIVFNDIKIDLRKHLVIVKDEELPLTKKEYDIFVYLIKNHEEVLSKEKIFYDIWQTNFMGETRALDMHIKSIRQKLESSNSNVSVETVYGVGYKIGVK